MCRYAQFIPKMTPNYFIMVYYTKIINIMAFYIGNNCQTATQLIKE